MTVRARRPRLAKSAAQLGVLVVVGLASALAIVYFAKALSQLDEVATTNSRLSLADRAIAGGNSIIVDQQAAYEARALIPRSESYRVVTGSPVKDATSLTATFVGTWFRYFLMPRRPADEARWVICYGCDQRLLRGHTRWVWTDENGLAIGRMR